MEKFDEYQRHLRYKYGSHAFGLITVLNLLNYLLSMRGVQWAETRTAEFILITFVAMTYAVTMYVYHGAYLKKRQSGLLFLAWLLIFGGIQLLELLSPYTTVISEGRITAEAVVPLTQMIWLLGALAYIVRLVVEKRREALENT